MTCVGIVQYTAYGLAVAIVSLPVAVLIGRFFRLTEKNLPPRCNHLWSVKFSPSGHTFAACESCPAVRLGASK